MTTGSHDAVGDGTLSWQKRLRLAVTRPEFTTDILQILKSVVAATAAWWLAVVVLESSMPFLAPWVALLTVYPTVYQSLKRGAQTTIASWAGVGVSFLIGQFLGVEVWTFALAILVGLAASRIPGIRNEGVAIATTAVFVLSDGFTEQQPMLFDRIIEVAVGAAVGLLVNLLLIPPLRDRQAARYVDHINRRMGRVFVMMADELESSWTTDDEDEWSREIESMGEDLRSAWQSVRTAQESRRANPRLRRRLQRVQGKPDQADYGEILQRVDEGISHQRHLVRTLREASYAPGEWDTRFREGWVTILHDIGYAIADPDREVEPIDDRLVQLSADLSDDADLPTRSWPLYGSLITSLRHIARVVDDVASAREAREAGAGNPKS
ncbi:FUSC family protein [Brevibacterium yomogidense]|uniref:Cytochrome c-type biogenesis protein DsbD, protein-disulfide reductase n=1 Tax=Brevibacterium yomogidense TaxID=946573 RepID=A0A1X6XJ04_9MICO|nr:aromatic acid exporter family protein [Brevibacterium yomogidense]SLM99285.1 Cytochrome c-type biogenesis protein DsbD, protein-disulfide reductase [Brevibacterium yomogidense]